MHTALMVILPILVTPLAIGLLAAVLNPGRADSLLKRVVGDAPRFPRGGYAVMDERAPITGSSPATAERAS